MLPKLMLIWLTQIFPKSINYFWQSRAAFYDEMFLLKDYSFVINKFYTSVVDNVCVKKTIYYFHNKPMNTCNNIIKVIKCTIFIF